MTESLKNYIVYDSELEEIYLKGEFGVYSDKPFTADDEFAFMKDFYIGKAPQKVTETTSEGLPFFRGTLSVSQKVIFPEDVTHLRVGGTYQLATVSINGKMAGKLTFDRVVEIKDYIQPGENLVQIDFTISNRNLLGPHHCTDIHNRYGSNPFAWELSNDWVKDEKKRLPQQL